MTICLDAVRRMVSYADWTNPRIGGREYILLMLFLPWPSVHNTRGQVPWATSVISTFASWSTPFAKNPFAMTKGYAGLTNVDISRAPVDHRRQRDNADVLHGQTVDIATCARHFDHGFAGFAWTNVDQRRTWSVVRSGTSAVARFTQRSKAPTKNRPIFLERFYGATVRGVIKKRSTLSSNEKSLTACRSR